VQGRGIIIIEGLRLRHACLRSGIRLPGLCRGCLLRACVTVLWGRGG
jgi:hypothetical protein